MTTAFAASDAEGAWVWRDAYDAIEAALVLQLRRLAPQIGRLEDAPGEITALLANLSGLSLTHTRPQQRFSRLQLKFTLVGRRGAGCAKTQRGDPPRSSTAKLASPRWRQPRVR